jgi:hypothetical protein
MRSKAKSAEKAERISKFNMLVGRKISNLRKEIKKVKY